MARSHIICSGLACSYPAVLIEVLGSRPRQDMLLGKSGDVIDRIATKICELSGLTDKAAEDLEKNL